MSISPERKPIPNAVREFFKFSARETGKICPYCGEPLRGSYHISHVIPVISYGDCQDKRVLVAMHPECNSVLGTNILDISGYDEDDLVLCEI